MSLDKLIPLFPGRYRPDNCDAFDYTSTGYIAFGSGSSVNFCYSTKFALFRGYSIRVPRGLVTALKFHQSNTVYIGTSTGALNILSYTQRKYLITDFEREGYTRIQQIGFIGNDLVLVLHESRQLVAYTMKQESPYLVPVWEIIVPEEMTNFAVDPVNYSKIFVYGKGKTTFNLYRLAKLHQKPTCEHEELSMSENFVLESASFDVHLKDYVIIVTERSLLWYNSELNLVAPVKHHQKSTSQFMKIIQFKGDQSKLMALHKNGTLSLYEINNQFVLRLIKEVVHFQANLHLINGKLNPMRDDQLVVFYEPLGLALMDMSSFNIVSVCPVMTDEVTSVNCDGMSYIFGTANGTVRVGDMMNPNHICNYKVANRPVRYVASNSKAKRMYWATDNEFGEIDFTRGEVKRMPERALKVTRLVSSMNGGIAVQRDPTVLGIVINNVEHYYRSSAQIIDYCFDEVSSTAETGQVMILTSDRRCSVITYSGSGILNEPHGWRVEGDGEPSAIAWTGAHYAVGYGNGNVSVFRVKDRGLVATVLTKSGLVRRMSIVNGIVFGITVDGSLFAVEDKKLSIVKRNVVQFVAVSEKLILIRNKASNVNFVTYPDFQNLANKSRALALPSPDQLASVKIKGNPMIRNTTHYVPTILSRRRPNPEVAYESNEGYDFWLHLLNKQSMKMISRAADGTPKLYEKTLATLMMLTTPTTATQRNKVFTSLLYADRYNDAADVLFSSELSDDRMMMNTITAAAVLGFDEGITEEQVAVIKPAGISLIMNGKCLEGAKLLKMAKLDSVAIEYLLEANRLMVALPFIRNMEDGDEKRAILMSIAEKRWAAKQIREAFSYFLAAGELHAALCALYSLNRVTDCFFLKAYLTKHGLLKQMSEEKAKRLSGMMNVRDLCHLIDVQFHLRLEKLKIPMKKFFPEDTHAITEE